MAPKAGGARSQARTQAQPSQSQSQGPRGTQRGAPARGGRRQTQDEEMEEDEEDEGDEDEAPGGSVNVDGDQEVARRANDLVRIALFMEHKRLPLRRDDITKKVLAPHNRLFNRVFAAAQDKLRDTFGMELVEQPTRAGLEQEPAASASAGGGGAGPSGTQAADDDLSQARKATGMKKKSAATGSKSYILRSTLHPTLIALAAETHDDLLEEESSSLPSSSSDTSSVVDDDDEDSDDDSERPPKPSGSILSWSHTDHPGPLGILYTLLALILVHGRSLPDMDLRSYLRQLHLPATGSPVHFSSTSTTRSLTVDNYLFQLQRQGYLERRSIGETGRPTGAGSKRMRATQAVRNNDDGENAGQMFEWRWGPRAMCEVGEQRIAEFIGEFMVDGEPMANARAKEAKVKKMVDGVEKAAGSKLMEV